LYTGASRIELYASEGSLNYWTKVHVNGELQGYSPGKSDLGVVVLAIAKRAVVTLGLLQSKVNKVAHNNLEHGTDIYTLDLRDVVLLSYQYHPVISPFHACSFLIYYPPRSWYSLL
jgi:hypothetical protein